MKVSTKGRYGVRVMLELALRAGQGPALVGDLAEAQGIPPKYLHVLLGSLKASGLVKAQRGPQGGIELAREAHRISVLDVVEAMEGPVDLAEAESGAIQALWQEASAGLRQALAGTTLAALAEQQRLLGARTDSWSI